MRGTRLLDLAAVHGVTPLIAARLGAASLASWPAAVQAALRRELAFGAALEAIRQRELLEVLDALGARGVRGLLLKGSALAHTVYPNSALRPRFDVDLLVRRDQIDIVGAVMTGRGYSRPALVTGDLVMQQVDYAKRDGHGVWHIFDFHWKLANRQAVADMLTRAELDREAVPIEALGPYARGLGRVHALMLACVHRVAHHADEQRLIWVYDIHLLTESLTPTEAHAFAALAADRSVSALCADGLEAAAHWFQTHIPEGLLDRLAAAGRAHEPSAVLLGGQGSRWNELVSDLKALPRWSHRMRLVYQHAFPPPGYMTDRYTVSSRVWLPALYTHRIVRGAWKWLRRSAR